MRNDTRAKESLNDVIPKFHLLWLGVVRSRSVDDRNGNSNRFINSIPFSWRLPMTKGNCHLVFSIKLKEMEWYRCFSKSIAVGRGTWINSVWITVIHYCKLYHVIYLDVKICNHVDQIITIDSNLRAKRYRVGVRKLQIVFEIFQQLFSLLWN